MEDVIVVEDWQQNEIFTINKIKEGLSRATDNFTYIGGYLDDAKYFCCNVFNENKGRPCKNVYEWAELRFGFKKSTTIALIGVCLRFGEYKQHLKKEFESYNFTQLVEMLPMPNELLSFITPDMSAKQIRDFKNVSKNSDQSTGQKINCLENKGIERFIVLKNDTERINFLKNYADWGLWFEEQRLGIKYYRCMLNNGDYIIASVPNPYYFYDNKLVYPSPNFKIIKAGTDKNNARYNFYFNSDAEILTYLRSTKAKFVEDFWGDKAREHKQHIEEFQEQSKKDSNQKYRKEKSIKKAIEKGMNYIGSMKGVNNEE